MVTDSAPVDRVKSLIAKLDPMAMMEDGGLQRATIAIGLLEQQAMEAGTAGAVAQVSGAVRSLLQTALLHPEAKLRYGAVSTLLSLVKQGDARFFEVAFDSMLTRALHRMLAEADRRVKAEGEAAEEEAVDPDLPKRRLALQILEVLALHPTADVAMQTLGADDLKYAPLDLMGNGDGEIRKGACLLLMGILKRADDVSALVRDAVDEVAEGGGAQLVQKALADEDEEVRAAARGALEMLPASNRVHGALAKLGEEEAGDAAAE